MNMKSNLQTRGIFRLKVYKVDRKDKNKKEM